MPDRRPAPPGLSLADALDRSLMLVHELVDGDAAASADLVAGFGDTRMLFTADRRNLASGSGQHALVTAVNLIARLGVSVALDIPDVPLLGWQPPLRGRRLGDALDDFVGDLLPGYGPDRSGAPPHAVVVIGDSPWASHGDAAWRLCGDPWSGAIAPLTAQVPVWKGDFPVGALAAAALAATEVFKLAVRRLGRRTAPGRDRYLLPVLGARQSPEPALAVAPRGPLALDCISAGAITNAALYTLFRVPGIAGRGRILDGDQLEGSNQNRYVLCRWSDVGQPKPDLLAAHAPPGWELTPVRQHLTEAAGAHPERGADFVLAGTDAIEPRWWIQARWPHWLGVGATSHFEVVVSEHEDGRGCAGCLHPEAEHIEGHIPTVGFVSFWSGLILASRLLRKLTGAAAPAGHQQTYLCPLRMDEPNARMEYEVTPRPDCPVRCAASRSL